MDPDATLKELMDIIGDYDQGQDIDVERVVELVESLDAWMSKGGFPPKGWSQ